MSDARSPQSTPMALLDTSIQIDRCKNPTRRRRIGSILTEFDWKVATSISLLEFKATIIQECITIHNQLQLRKRYTVVVDALTEKNHRQAKLRGHVFRNLVNVFSASPFHVTEERDERLAEKARLRLESIIPRLYRWFVQESVDAILKDGIKCTRADEAPKKKRVSFGVNLPRCRRGHNKTCCVEEFIRKHAGMLVRALRGMNDTSEQLNRACNVFDLVQQDPTRELSNGDCRHAGDCLIALEAKDHATHALSTNATE